MDGARHVTWGRLGLVSSQPRLSAAVAGGAARDERPLGDIAVFLNPKAGTARHPHLAVGPRRIADLFRAAGVTADVTLTPPASLAAAVADAVARGAEAIVVGGGDGTLRAAAALLAGGEIPLGVLPFGTFNHFAKDIGMPLGLHEAVAAIAVGRRASVDVIEVNGHLFLNNCAIGAYPTMVARREQRRRRFALPKWLAATEGFLGTMARPPVVEIDLHHSGRHDRLRTSFVLLSNNRYRMRRAGFTRRIALDEGELVAYATRTPSRLAAAAAFARILTGLPHTGPVLSTSCGAELTIAASGGPLLVSLDGEIRRLTPPLCFGVLHRHLPVISPRGASDAR